MATTSVIAKFDVKYGQESLVVPTNLQVPVDLMGRLDMDVPPSHTTTGSISYPGSQKDPSGTDYSTVVFLLISATAKTVPFAGLRFSVDPDAAKATSGGTPAPAQAPLPAPAPAPAAARGSSGHSPAPPPGESEEENAADEGAEPYGRPPHAPPRQAQQPPAKSAGTPAAPAPASPPPAPDTSKSAPRWFVLEFPLVLLGNGQVSALDANPTTFTFKNASSTDPVQVSVRVGRQLKQSS